jgi:hypothetical protein
MDVTVGTDQRGDVDPITANFSGEIAEDRKRGHHLELRCFFAAQKQAGSLRPPQGQPKSAAETTKRSPSATARR